jgi:type II secretory ATPase GspE/PulE/Tfp pilus assembly ATPase PilB-like protein
VGTTEQIECFHGRGCGACEGTGYSGRLAIFEFLPIDDQLREKITQGASEIEIRSIARKKGYGGLLESAVGRLREGLTSLEEVLRVAFVKDVDATDDYVKVSSDDKPEGGLI